MHVSLLAFVMIHQAVKGFSKDIGFLNTGADRR